MTRVFGAALVAVFATSLLLAQATTTTTPKPATGPTPSKTTSPSPTPSTVTTSSPTLATRREPLDINSATEAQLMQLPGIGKALAAKIIAGRPYANKTQLTSKKILTSAAYAKISGEIIAKQK
jgi:DNA uptake protein ComE-like DNA-binding protein